MSLNLAKKLHAKGPSWSSPQLLKRYRNSLLLWKPKVHRHIYKIPPLAQPEATVKSNLRDMAITGLNISLSWSENKL